MPMNFAGRFAGRSAVITGGASGIGLAVAHR
ncbi:3-oxoacyl-ACP reductase, partial [Mesorhizobium sp. M2D.F.Ca.ET.185.01.1.1]